jgi:monoamine oxidase
MDCDVVIVGAGAAGVLAARDLARADRRIVVLEASDRIGGRVRSVADPRALGSIELGPEFVHGRPAITYGLLREFGQTTIDDADAGFVVRNGSLHAVEDDPFARAGALIARALDRDEDETVAASLARHATDATSRDAAEVARRMISGFDAADPARASARAIALEWASDASAEGAQSRPLGGYAPLVAHLARGLDSARVRVRFETIATNVAYDSSGVTVAATRGTTPVSIRARHAIVTVPVGVLRANVGERGAIAFDPPLPAQTRDAIHHIAMGPVVKVVLRFATPFWESLAGGAWRDGAFFSCDEAFPTFWTQLPLRATTLTAWAGGPYADRLAALDERAAIALALDGAGRTFGDPASARSAFEAGYVHDWQRDPFSRGAYSYVLAGGERARATLGRSIADRLWIAGEATATDGEGGTVAGALESGRRAAREICARGAASD